MQASSTTDRPIKSRRRVPRCLLGAWQLGPMLGEGTYFRVFRSKSIHGVADGWDFAIKTVRPEQRGRRDLSQRIEREAAAGMSVASPHVVPIVDSRPGEFVVMPRVRGVTLQRLIQARPLPLGLVIWIGRQLAEGLLAMHEAGWIHGDIKPENVMISPGGHATLIDLGFAQRVELHLPCTVRQCDRQGTLRYLAPEMLSTSVPILPQSDIYSLGVILFELLTQRRLFDQETTEQIVRAQLSQRAPSVARLQPQVPRTLADLVARMLMKDPLRRPWPDAELVSQLAEMELELLSGGTMGAAMLDEPAATTKDSRRVYETSTDSIVLDPAVPRVNV